VIVDRPCNVPVGSGQERLCLGFSNTCHSHHLINLFVLYRIVVRRSSGSVALRVGTIVVTIERAVFLVIILLHVRETLVTPAASRWPIWAMVLVMFGLVLWQHLLTAFRAFPTAVGDMFAFNLITHSDRISTDLTLRLPVATFLQMVEDPFNPYLQPTIRAFSARGAP